MADSINLLIEETVEVNSVSVVTQTTTVTVAEFLVVAGEGGTPEGTAVLSTGETSGKVLQADGDNSCSWVALAGGGNAQTANPLSQFAATTIAQLNGVLSDANLVDNNAAVILNTDKTGISSTQTSNITTNNSKVSYTDASAVSANTAKTGITSQQTSDITANNAKVSYTDSAAVSANTAKTGITSTQASNITTNNSKVGVTDEQENTINTTTTGEPTGSDLVLNVVSLTQAEYDAGTKVATTFYLITDA